MGINCKLKRWKIVPFVILGIAGLGWVIMALWNWLIPALFAGGREIDYMQALGVLVLSKILFGGLRGHGYHGRWHKHRLESMSPEEREKFETGMRNCCGGDKKQEDSRTLAEHHD